MSYPTLGKFDIPSTPNWVPGVRYTPEPPLAIRGAMNPWDAERQRTLYLAEESAWKSILPLQAQYTSTLAVFNRQLATYNNLVGQLEGLVGQSTGLLRGGGAIGSMVFQPVNIAFDMVTSLISMIPGIGGLFGKKKKKAEEKQRQAQALMSQIDAQQALLVKTQQTLNGLETQISGYLNTAEAIRANQPVKIAADTAQNVQAQQDRASLDTLRASVLQQRIRQTELNRQQGSHANATNQAL